MRRIAFMVLLACVLTGASPATAESARVLKVLPMLLDNRGRHALSPSLYDRDAYQFYLQQHPALRSGIQMNVQWKARGFDRPLTLRMELRGSTSTNLPPALVLDREVKPGGWFSHWTTTSITGDQFMKFGNLTAWRVTLWNGDQMLSEQKSFLW